MTNKRKPTQIAAKPAHAKPQPLCYYSIWLSMNFLTLDPKTVIVEETEVYQNEQLDKLGFEVIPIPFRNAYPFGGSIHCGSFFSLNSTVVTDVDRIAWGIISTGSGTPFPTPDPTLFRNACVAWVCGYVGTGHAFP